MHCSNVQRAYTSLAVANLGVQKLAVRSAEPVHPTESKREAALGDQLVGEPGNSISIVKPVMKHLPRELGC